MRHCHPHEGPLHEPPDIEGLDPLTAGVFSAFKRSMRLNRQLMGRMLGEQGGHPGQAMCLTVLSRSDGITQRELADLLHLAAPTVTAMLQKMEKAGLLERWTDSKDQRLTRIRLTDEGRCHAAALAEAHATYLRVSIGSLPVEEQRELKRLFERLADNVEEALRELGDFPAHASEREPRTR